MKANSDVFRHFTIETSHNVFRDTEAKSFQKQFQSTSENFRDIEVKSGTFGDISDYRPQIYF